MDIDKELRIVAAELGNPLRKRPDYGFDDILSKLAEHAGLDIEDLQTKEKEDVGTGTEDNR